MHRRTIYLKDHLGNGRVWWKWDENETFEDNSMEAELPISLDFNGDGSVSFNNSSGIFFQGFTRSTQIIEGDGGISRKLHASDLTVNAGIESGLVYDDVLVLESTPPNFYWLTTATDCEAYAEGQLIYSGTSVVGEKLSVERVEDKIEFKRDGVEVASQTDNSPETYLRGHLRMAANTAFEVNVFETTPAGKPVVLQQKDYYPFGMEHADPQSSQSGVVNNYTYNGKEMNNDFDLGWIDYGARFYNPQLGRWSAIDPLAEKVYGLSPYHYALNNPLLFIDPDGMEGTIYLVAMESAQEKYSPEELQGFVDEANKIFEELEVDVRVHLWDGDSKDFDKSKLDDTDGVAMLGNQEEVSAFNKKHTGRNAEAYNNDWNDSGNPEVTPRGGRFIGIDINQIDQFAESTESTTSYGTGFLIAHGAGHSAGAGHDYQNDDPSIMTDGQVVGASVNAHHTITPTFDINNLSDFVSSPANQKYIPAYQNTFGNVFYPTYKGSGFYPPQPQPVKN